MKKKIVLILVLLISIKGISQQPVSEKVTYHNYNYKCYHWGKIKKKTVIDVMDVKDKDVSAKVSLEAVDKGWSQGNAILDAITGYSDVDNTTCHGSNDGSHSYNEVSNSTVIKTVVAIKGSSKQ